MKNQDRSISYYREDPHWSKTLYVCGLPRSGKSTLKSILGSCELVESLEEPFDLTLLAQKGSCFPSNTNMYQSYLDSFMASMENSFSELSMGRNYNFREQDKSYIYNIKSKQQVNDAHEISRRRDLLHLNADKSKVFLIVFNDVEISLNLITEKGPNPTIIFLNRDPFRGAQEIATKGWLSDTNLSSQADLTPAYNLIRSSGNRVIYVPHLVDEQNVDLFLSLDNENRSILYAYLQEKLFRSTLANITKPILEIMFDDLMGKTRKIANQLFDSLDLKPTDITEKNIRLLEEQKEPIFSNGGFRIDRGLAGYLSTLGVSLNEEY